MKNSENPIVWERRASPAWHFELAAEAARGWDKEKRRWLVVRGNPCLSLPTTATAPRTSLWEAAQSDAVLGAQPSWHLWEQWAWARVRGTSPSCAQRNCCLLMPALWSSSLCWGGYCCETASASRTGLCAGVFNEGRVSHAATVMSQSSHRWLYPHVVCFVPGFTVACWVSDSELCVSSIPVAARLFKLPRCNSCWVVETNTVYLWGLFFFFSL